MTRLALYSKRHGFRPFCSCLASVAMFACSPKAITQQPTAPSLDVTTERVIVTPEAALGVSGWLERGRSLHDAGQFREALSDFDRVLEHDLEQVWSAEALFYSGLANEALEDFRAAAAAHEQLVRRFPKSQYARQGLVRAVRIRGYLEDWARAGELAGALAAQRDLSPRDAIVAYSAKALGILSQIEPIHARSLRSEDSHQLAPVASAGPLPGPPKVGRGEQLERAQLWISKGRRIIERYRLDSAGTIPRDLAQLYFAMGELRRMRGELLIFDPFPPDFPERFERRAQLLLDAQRAYSEVMRAHDSHWTAMAGFRVGQLYTRLHRDVMATPRPPTADTPRRRNLLEAAIRVRYSVLLRKGLGMYDHILAMAARTGEDSPWVAGARQARADLFNALRHEEQALEATDYTRMELENALETMRR